ncbi:unnamed protein product (macronuclear) [Paramecium tetraurelia]|uniref:Uncharacterized protein n=1 Tax=Paramecium tetraurelia TaxID=5888 RepID=A0D8V6_PARTE|nr:uncharacterized protein GSPATT00014419001 [Paramecium tetraurelia]CAK79473.1 unnamed protein product [Paramecium tetraurelia]|eukprot:XP_001446870.1 hypothetical protein (macronuclear) [Paramecium tetraurelia strain d4-2]
MQIKRSSIEQGGLEQILDGNMSPIALQLDLEQDTQSIMSKNDTKNKFQPFQNERNSIGKLIQRTKSNDTTSKFHFLKSQQVVLLAKGKETVPHVSLAHQLSTTYLLGLKKRDITPMDKAVSLRQRLRNFKINLQADQGFIKQFREYKKQYIPKTQLSRAFLTPRREHFYRDTHTPGPGVYSDQLLITEPGQSMEFNKSPQMRKSPSPICQRDFYDFQFMKRNDNSPDFQRTISRDKAYQRSIFAQIEIQKKENMKLQKEEPYDEQEINRDIEYLLYQQQKYGKLNYQRILDSNNEIKKFAQPDALDTNWSKMLERYGFKRLKGGKIKKQRVQTAANG